MLETVMARAVREMERGLVLLLVVVVVVMVMVEGWLGD